MVTTEIDTEASPTKAWHEDGIIHVSLDDGMQLSFPVTLTERLTRATPYELAEIELLPFGLHWPRLDEDLTIETLLRLGFGR